MIKEKIPITAPQQLLPRKVGRNKFEFSAYLHEEKVDNTELPPNFFKQEDTGRVSFRQGEKDTL